MAMFVDFATLARLVPHVIKARKPILIRGKHGIGKSEIVYQLASKVATYMGLKDKTYVYPIVERRASQMADAGDLMGLPQLDGETTHFLPMKWFYQACVQPVILFLDEVDRAPSDVRQAIFELTDSRKIAGHSLHPDTIVIACVNGGEGENSYQVGEMDPAELSRWTVFDVKPSLQDWLDYAKGKVDDVIHDFIRQNPSFLEHSQGEFTPNKVYPCRRSWFRFNESVSGTNMIEEASLDLLYLCNSFVGTEAATTFQDFAKNYSRQVTVEDIVEHGKLDKVTKFEINQHMVLIEKMNESELMKTALNPNQLQNLAKYIFAIPAELAMKLWEVATCLNQENGLNLYQTEINGKYVSDFIAQLNGAVTDVTAPVL